MNWILRIDNLGKVYRMGAGPTQQGTLYEQFSRKVKKIVTKKVENIQELDSSSSKTVVSSEQTEGLKPGYFWALKDINIQISPGERIGLIGPNGSGKSTLLKIISRITAPTYGEFKYRGHLISLLEVGTGFHPELSGRENIYLNAFINGMTRKQINERYNDIVEFSELGSHIDTPVKRYSSGMYMRLAFSVAAFLESEILVIDEVLAVGDAAFQKKCKDKMLAVANDGRSVIFVSHDMSAIESICKKTFELSHGKIINTRNIELSKETEIKFPPEIITPELIPPLIPADMSKTLGVEKNWLEDLTAAPCIKDILHVSFLRLVNDQGFVQDKFTSFENINLEIQFNILKNHTKLCVTTKITSVDGTTLFTLTDYPSTSPKSLRDKGLFLERVTIPKEFLNEGQFLISISFNVLNGNEQDLDCKDCLIIEIINNPLRLESNIEPRLGLLRPNFNWHFEFNASQKQPNEEEIKSFN